MDPQLFCLRWNNHQTNLLSVFDQLLQVEAFCDVTLAVDGASIKCHKMVLAACSNYFQSLFMENTCKHPIVFLKDIRFNQIRALLDYMYHGEVSVEEAELPSLLKIAEALKVKGLVESEEERAAQATPVKAKGAQRPPGIRPVNTAKLLSPTAKGPREPTEEDPGHLVIDEESGEASGPTTMSPLDVDYDMNYLTDEPPAPGMVKTIGANGKVEWKRYKQYTKDDILAAIEEVKSGMSALQASRKYGVPSRTLYDKVKKMGILTANMQKQLNQKNQNQKGSDVELKGGTNGGSYPPINLLGLQLPQSSLPQQDKDGKPVPPFSGAMMMSMIERMKLVAGAGGMKPHSSPLNLSAMLDASTGGSEEDSQRSTESNRSSEDIDMKQEGGPPENIGDADIRAQFFAQLASSLADPKEKPPASSVSASVIRPVNGPPPEPAACLPLPPAACLPPAAQESKVVTLAPRGGSPGPGDQGALPHRKRKYSHDEPGEGALEGREAVEAGPC